MLSNTFSFYSSRIKKTVSVTMEIDYVQFSADDMEHIFIERDPCWHINEDGFDRVQSVFDDPRFTYWYCK